VQDYAGSSNKASLVGLEFSGGEVPVDYSFDWGRDWRQDDTQGISKNFTVTQQGFTANVTCQAINRSVDSFSLYPYVTQGPLNNTFLSYIALANCSGSEFHLYHELVHHLITFRYEYDDLFHRRQCE
jgi:hypothetical protein